MFIAPPRVEIVPVPPVGAVKVNPEPAGLENVNVPAAALVFTVPATVVLVEVSVPEPV